MPVGVHRDEGPSVYVEFLRDPTLHCPLAGRGRFLMSGDWISG